MVTVAEEVEAVADTTGEDFSFNLLRCCLH